MLMLLYEISGCLCVVKVMPCHQAAMAQTLLTLYSVQVISGLRKGRWKAIAGVMLEQKALPASGHV